MIELETPQTPRELLKALITERVSQEIENLKNQQANGGAVFLPKNHYQVGQQLSFPKYDWKNGSVKSIRPGNNPELPSFEVIAVQFEDGENKLFATGVEDHKLNKPVDVKLDDPLLNEDYILKKYSGLLLGRLTTYLESNEDIVRIAGKWFPRALLVDVNIGHLNLAEAVLEMAEGGPLPTHTILEQIELPTDVNSKLTEFSLNLALQEDGRFDEVGPSGEVVWFLRRLEPEGVRNVPSYLVFIPVESSAEVNSDLHTALLRDIEDELESANFEDLDQLTIPLIYPHWRSGTLPLSDRIKKLLPTAYESPRVQFTFIDRETRQKISAWVVRSSGYVFGLRDWFQSKGLFPGCLVNIQRSNTPGEVIIWVDKKRPSREWVRTTLIGTDGGMVFAMLKQMVVAPYDERMAVVVPDTTTLDGLWEGASGKRGGLEGTIRRMSFELAKLSSQGHVHAIELYATVNLVRRCPPGVILNILLESAWSKNLGNLYFRPEEASQEGNSQ